MCPAMAVNLGRIDSGIGLPGHFFQLRLGIEQVDMAGAAFHEQPDDRLGRGRDGAAAWAASGSGTAVGRA